MIKNPRVERAIRFVEGELGQKLERPWIYYSPVQTLQELEERNALIEKYGQAQPNELQYYLLYHRCHEAAVFYWTVLGGTIVYQQYPFPHTYLELDGQIIDPLLSSAGVAYPYHPESAQRFQTPHDFYAGVFIPQEDRRDWEIELLEQLRALEN